MNKPFKEIMKAKAVTLAAQVLKTVDCEAHLKESRRACRRCSALEASEMLLNSANPKPFG